MPRPVIPHDAFIFVGDGCKALFLRNEGDEKFANFVTEEVFRDEDPLTHEQGTDRPGRAYAAAPTTMSRHAMTRSAIEQTDWHRIEEHRFTKKVAEALERLVRERGARLVIAAPPRALADLRKALHPDVQARIIAEINKDFTNHPVADIERHVLEALASL